MHRLVTPEEAERMVEDFERRHAGHFGRTITRASEEKADGWAVVLYCPPCGAWETAEEDNDARKTALAYRTVRRVVAS